MTKPRPLREHDTLGRAGRVSTKGNPIETVRARTTTPHDQRRTTIEVAGVENPRLVITTPANVDLPAEDTARNGGHRGIQYLDGRSEARPPAAWEKANSELGSQRAADEREALARLLKRRRAALPLAERVARQKQREQVMQSQRARALPATDADARHGGGGGDRILTGDDECAVGFTSSVERAARWRQIELLVELLEADFDAHDGIEVKDVSMMGKPEKDALLCSAKLRGLSPDEICAIYGGHLGKPDTIRKCRNEHGLTKYGLPLPRADERRAA